MSDDNFIQPRWMGVFKSAEGAEAPFFIRAVPGENEINGSGVDKYGPFCISGGPRKGRIHLRKEYLDADTHAPTGRIFDYVGTREGDKISGFYLFNRPADCATKCPIIGDGTFVMESYHPSETMTSVVMSIERLLTIRNF